MSDKKEFWDSYFNEESEAPEYVAKDETVESTPEPIENINPDSKAPEVTENTAPEGFVNYDTSDTGPENFKINFDFDGVYRDVPAAKPFVARREKRSGCVGGLLYGIFIICVSLIAGILLWMAAVDVLALGKADEKVIQPFGLVKNLEFFKKSM